MNLFYKKPVFRFAGDSCIFMEIGNDISPIIHRRIRGIFNYLRQKDFKGIKDITAAYRSINIYFDPLILSHEEIISLLNKANRFSKEVKEFDARRIYMPTHFGGEFGPDLDRVAKTHNLTNDEVIKIFTEKDYLNYFNGFMPGKPYLGVLPEILETPRLKSPRFNVKMGAVVIYGKQLALFGLPEPTGTNWIGSSPVRIYDIRKKDPAFLKIGDYLHFYQVDRKEYEKIEKAVEEQTYNIKTEYFEEI